MNSKGFHKKRFKVQQEITEITCLFLIHQQKGRKIWGIPNTNESNRVEKITTTQEFRQKIDMIFVL